MVSSRAIALPLVALVVAACRPEPESAGGLPATQTPSAPQATRTSALVFPERGKDVGKIVHPGSTATTFAFHNAGTKPVGIVDILASCGCTEPHVRVVKNGKVVRDGHARGSVRGPLLTILPGEEGELTVRVETATLQSSVKEHMSRISIATDEVVDPIDLFLRVEVERLFDVVPSMLAFEPMGAKQVQRGEVKVLIFSPDAEPPFEPTVVAEPAGIRTEAIETVDGVRPILWVVATAGPGLPATGVQGEIRIEFRFGKGGAKETKTVSIPVAVPVVADVSWKPSNFDFQVVTAESPARSAPVVLQLLDPDRTLHLGEPRIEGETASRLTLEIEPLEEGKSYRLTLVASIGFPQATAQGHHGLVRIESGLADFPELRIPFRAYTRSSPPKAGKQ